MWACLLCSRSGDEIEIEEAKRKHTNMLLIDKHNNQVMTARFGSWTGPSSECRGRIVIGKVVEKQKRKKSVSGVFVDEQGDGFIETSRKIKVNGKIVERGEK